MANEESGGGSRRKSAMVLLTCLVAAPSQAATVSGSLALTSDYVWRGTTQTQGDASAQASVRVAGANGFYLSVWGSNVEFAPETHASSELDIAAGWTGALDDDCVLGLNVSCRSRSASVFLKESPCLPG